MAEILIKGIPSQESDEFYVAPEEDFFVQKIKYTGSWFFNKALYRCHSPTYYNSVIHNYVMGLRAYDKKVGDTCRMWVAFDNFDKYIIAGKDFTLRQKL